MREIDKQHRWKGDAAGYVAKHMWLTAHYAKHDTCDECGTTEYSRLEWANISGRHIRDRADYKVLCPSCHRKMDAKPQCKHGHAYTQENTFINANGHRECRICRWRRRHANN